MRGAEAALIPSRSRSRKLTGSRRPSSTVRDALPPRLTAQWGPGKGPSRRPIMHPDRHDHRALARLRAALLPNCREMCRHSSGAVDGCLPWWQWPGIHLHLAFCRLCRRYRAQIIWLHRAARGPRATEIPGSRLPESARSRMIQSLREQLRPTAPGGPNAGNAPLSPPQ